MDVERYQIAIAILLLVIIVAIMTSCVHAIQHVHGYAKVVFLLVMVSTPFLAIFIVYALALLYATIRDRC